MSQEKAERQPTSNASQCVTRQLANKSVAKKHFSYVGLLFSANIFEQMLLSKHP